MLITLLAACGSSTTKGSEPVNGEVAGSSASTGRTTEMTSTEAVNSTTSSDTKVNDSTEPAETNEAANQDSANEQLLQSASIDLDGDGVNEQVEAVQISSDTAGAGSADELEGRLKIKGGSSDRQITFYKKNAETSGVLTSLQFEDLDGDGAKEIFIIIPDNGASFSISNYYIYSYKKNISYTFTSDNNLADFISNFSFKYTGGNKLSMINSQKNFSAELTIELGDDQQPQEDYMKDYEQSAWIDPVSVDISESSRLALTTSGNGMPEIKVPLPIFGLATVDMIGELDLYYSIDSSFNPVLKRFEVMDFKGADMAKVGSCNLN